MRRSKVYLPPHGRTEQCTPPHGAESDPSHDIQTATGCQYFPGQESQTAAHDQYFTDQVAAEYQTDQQADVLGRPASDVWQGETSGAQYGSSPSPACTANTVSFSSFAMDPAPVVLATSFPAPEKEACDEHSPGKKRRTEPEVVAPPEKTVYDKIEMRLNVGRKAALNGEKQEWRQLAVCEREYKQVPGNYLRGCKWSPDGKMLMTNSNDNIIRIYDIPFDTLERSWGVHKGLTTKTKVPESDTVYDFAWYPGMKSDDQATCLLATSVKQLPIHVWSAVTGKLVCTFRPYNNVDEIVAAHSIGFNCTGQYLVAGFNKKIRIFDTKRPGRECVNSSTVVKEEMGGLTCVRGQRGILSCFAAHPTNSKIMAAGAFNGDVAVYDISTGGQTTVFEGQPGGITHMTFSKDGNYLFAGGRKDPEINCFDLRSPEKVLFVIYRHVATNQRMYFDIDRSSRYLLSGHHNGNVSVWDLEENARPNSLLPWKRLDPVSHFSAHQDTVNGLHINPCLPYLATCCGQRHFPESIFRDPEDSPLEWSPDATTEENSLKIWSLKLP